MIMNIFITKEIERKIENLSSATSRKIYKIFNEIHRGKLGRIINIPKSQLYGKKVSNYYIIFSKRMNKIFVVDIIKREDLFNEIKKSITFLF